MCVFVRARVPGVSVSLSACVPRKILGNNKEVVQGR